MTTNQLHKLYTLGVLFALACILSASSVSASEPNINSLVQQVIPAVVRVTGYIRSAGAENDYRKHGESSGFFFDRRGLLFTVYSPYVELRTRTLCEKFDVELYEGRVQNAEPQPLLFKSGIGQQHFVNRGYRANGYGMLFGRSLLLT